MGLRILFDERRTLGLDDRPSNRESSGLLVEIRPAKGAELTPSCPVVAASDRKHAKSGSARSASQSGGEPCLVREDSKPAFVPEGVVPVRLDSLQSAPAHCLIECSPDDGMGLSDRRRRERAAILAPAVTQLRIKTVKLISPQLGERHPSDVRFDVAADDSFVAANCRWREVLPNEVEPATDQFTEGGVLRSMSTA